MVWLGSKQNFICCIAITSVLLLCQRYLMVGELKKMDNKPQTIWLQILKVTALIWVQDIHKLGSPCSLLPVALISCSKSCWGISWLASKHWSRSWGEVKLHLEAGETTFIHFCEGKDKVCVEISSPWLRRFLRLKT